MAVFCKRPWRNLNSPVNWADSALATRNQEYAEEDGQPIEKARLVIIEMGLLMGGQQCRI